MLVVKMEGGDKPPRSWLSPRLPCPWPCTPEALVGRGTLPARGPEGTFQVWDMAP